MVHCRFGRARSDAEKFLAALRDVYCLQRVRVLGDDIRLLKCYPGDWQVHLTTSAIMCYQLYSLKFGYNILTMGIIYLLWVYTRHGCNILTVGMTHSLWV